MPAVHGPHHEWYSCRRKLRYSSEAEAVASAAWAEFIEPRDTDGPHAYLCGYCATWHIGRVLRSRSRMRKWQRRKARARFRPDVTMLGVLGARAYWCGEAESTGRPGQRLRAIASRVAAVEKRRERLAA